MSFLLLILIIFIMGIAPAIASQQNPTPATRTARQGRVVEPPNPPGGAALDEYANRYGVMAATEELANEVRFQKQCFLSYNMLKIHEKVRGLNGTTPGSLGPLTVPLRHHTILGDGTDAAPSDVTSTIVSRPDLREIFHIRPGLLSYFMPHIRIYKVFGTEGVGRATNTISTTPSTINAGDIPTEEVEFIFDSHITEQRMSDLLESGRGRGEGVGLNSFNWQFLGVNPAEVENNIKATLTLHFNNIRDFEEQRPARENPGLSYRFSDLVVPEPLYHLGANTPAFARAQNAFNPQFFRIKVVVGWATPPITEALRNSFPDVNFEEFAELVRLNKKVM